MDDDGKYQGHDQSLLQLNVIDSILTAAREKFYYVLWLAPPCGWWGGFCVQNGGSRTAGDPEGRTTNAREMEGTLNMAVALFIIMECLRSGTFFVLEHPEGSFLWQLPLLAAWMRDGSLEIVPLEQCAWGARPSDWVPSEGDVRIRKSTRLLTNAPFVSDLSRRCSGQPPRTRTGRSREWIETDTAGRRRQGTTPSACACTSPTSCARRGKTASSGSRRWCRR